MKKKGKGLSYYLASAAGFALGFAGIISPFAYYQVVKANDVIYKGIQKLSLPNSANLATLSVKLPVEEKGQNIPLKIAEPVITEDKKVEIPEKIIIETLPKLNTEPETNFSIETNILDESPKDIYRFANRLRDGKKVKMVATAYCLNGRTASGVFSKYGIIAADPKYLPIGSIVRIRGAEYTGLYSVLDTGAKIKGRKIDIYLTTGREAIQFGRRDITLEVLRYGWNPQVCNDMALEEKRY